MKLSTGGRSFLNSIIFLAIALGLQACGGGGGGGGGVAAPVIANASSQSYLEDETITALAFSNTGGGTLTNCSADSLPAGLSITVSSDSSTCEISGRPSTPSAAAVITITATNATASDTATVSIVIPTNTLSVTVSSADIKTVKFDWAAYSNAASYKLFVNPDGASGFSLLQDNLTGLTTTVTLPVHLTDWVNSSYLLEAYDGAGKLKESSPLSITSLMISSIGYVKASNSEVDDQFGESLDLSADGTTLIVGTFNEDSDGTSEADNSAADAGAVYVYTKNGSVWSQQAYLKASNAGANDYFGRRISLSSDGNTVAVGAFGESSNFNGISTDGTGETDNSLSASGAVYIFTRTGSSWSQQAYIKANTSDASDLFGVSVRLSNDGNTLAVGAAQEGSNGTGEADNSANGAGAAYIFTRTGTTWTQQTYIKASNSESGDLFGVEISLSADGNTLAVAATGEDSNATGVSTNGVGEANNAVPYAGAVYMFNYNGTSWSQVAYIKASNTGASENYAQDMVLSDDGKTLAVGAEGEDSNASGISIDGTGEADNSSLDSGAIYVYTLIGSTWSQQAYIKASNSEASDGFGRLPDLSADGNILTVSAPGESSNAVGINGDQTNNSAANAGAVYVFNRVGSTWTQQSYVKSSNTEANDSLGFTSISADGQTLAVGASTESSSATSIGGDQTDNTKSQSGAVYIY